MRRYLYFGNYAMCEPRNGEPARAEAEIRLLHNDQRFGGIAIWADGLVTNNVERRVDEKFEYVPPDQPTQFDESLLQVIRAAHESDSGCPRWLATAEKAALVRKTTSEPKTGHYAGPTLETIDFFFRDGTKQRKVVFSEGYFEGYCYEFFESEAAALRWRSRFGWTDLECLECGATYSEIGHVEPGAMGCDRCNN